VINWESDRRQPKFYATQMKALYNLLGFMLEDLVAAKRSETHS
jgi:hypothetical protein